MTFPYPLNWYARIVAVCKLNGDLISTFMVKKNPRILLTEDCVTR